VLTGNSNGARLATKASGRCSEDELADLGRDPNHVLEVIWDEQ
jgi:hypothetical protein